ncbi:MAG: immunity 42 family protein [Oscillospiraceae bacterium]|nr:immunity 42 family protein [Oscillospiraceae bacterium]
MIIGNTKNFAVEITLYEDHSPLLEGEFSYWINSEKLGENETVYLNDVYMSMIWFSQDNDRKYAEEIRGNFTEIFNELYDNIYNSEDFEGCPGRYDISVNICGGIGRYRVFYIEDNYYGYLLYKKNSNGTVNSFKIKKGKVGRALKEAFSVLDLMYENVHKGGIRSPSGNSKNENNY